MMKPRNLFVLSDLARSRRPGRRKPFFEKFGTLLKQRSDAFLLQVNNPVPPQGEESDVPGTGPGPSTVPVVLGPAGIQPIVANGAATPTGKTGDAENYVSMWGKLC
uniref:Uncharacterized protein n=1 Tax=Anopheles culicifacies TaxID=139723 RepID=A0A182MIE9_9DIPT